VKNAHPPLVDRATFELIRDRVESEKNGGRQRRHPYLLAGVGSVRQLRQSHVGTTRVRRKVSSVAAHEYALRRLRLLRRRKRRRLSSSRDPRDPSRREVLRVLDDEIFRSKALNARTAAPTDPRAASDWPKRHRYRTPRKRERELAEQVIEGAKRLLEVSADLVPDFAMRSSARKPNSRASGQRSTRAAKDRRGERPEAIVRETVNRGPRHGGDRPRSGEPSGASREMLRRCW